MNTVKDAEMFAEITKEEISKLKEKYPEGIYSASIRFNDEEKKPHTLRFVYRRPSEGDIESFTSSSQRNPIVANVNLIQSLIVQGDPAFVVNTLRRYPLAAGTFITEVISPFFGGDVITGSEKL